MPEDLGEKTEQPTPKRQSEARERGQVAKSTDLSSAIVLLGAVVGGAFFAPRLLEGLFYITRYNLSPASLSRDLTGVRVEADVAAVMSETARVIVPIMLIVVFFAYLSGLLQVGFLFSSRVLTPQFERLNPVKGVARLLSKRSLIKGVMDVLKFVLIGLVVYFVIAHRWVEVGSLASLHLTAAIVRAAWMVLELAIWVLLALILLGIIDFIYQRWQRQEDLKMTKHEVKDERRSSEGDAETKARRMKLAREIAMQRIQQDVPRADVIVTNPTHFAVAIRYDQATMNAPRVIAKGADFLAMRIRQIGVAAGVPIVERPPLARALYQQVNVGQEVNPEHYEAVAELLAYVYRLEGRAAG